MSKKINIPTSEQFGCRCNIEVRFADLDAMGHVNNATYITYFEIARTHMVRRLGFDISSPASLVEVFPFVLLEVSCRYLAPVVLGQTLVAHIKTSRIGRTSFSFDYLLTDSQSGKAMATGHSTQVLYDFANACSAPIPEDLRVGLERYMGPG